MVLLGQYVAIEFNNWIERARFIPLAMMVAALVLAFIVAVIAGGPRKRRLIAFGTLAASFAGIMIYFDMVYWFHRPAVDIPVYILLVIDIGALMTVLTSGLEDRKVQNAMGTTAPVSIISYSVLHGILMKTLSIPLLLSLLVVTVGVRTMAGQLLGGFSKRQASFASTVTGLLTSLAALVDLLPNDWATYLVKVDHPISAIDVPAPDLEITRQDEATDDPTHLLLPIIVLTLVPVASYTCYTWASMPEVLNQDYIRTARSKGVSERKVIARYALRNALIPPAAVVAFGFTSLIGGVVIMEMVPAWQGMGTLFESGLLEVDPIRAMGFLLITGMAVAVVGMPVDLTYAFLGPKIFR